MPYPNLVKQRRVWFVKVRVPNALRDIIGKSVLSRTTGLQDERKAATASAAILSEFHAIIQAAWERNRGLDRAWERASKPKLLWSVPAPSEWPIDGTMKPRQAQQYRGDAQLWIDTGRMNPQVFVEARLAVGDSPKTAKRRLSAIRAFAQWAELDFPSEPVRMPKRSAAKVAQRQSFTWSEVRRLLTTEDVQLRHLIAIAALTGCRLEEIATIKIASITVDALRVSSKTEAGDRSVPVIAPLRLLIDVLVPLADAEGYIIHSDAVNALGERGMALGKRFGRWKTSLGFPSTLVFHSLRKTVATALQDAGCPEHIAADILGHRIRTMSYGVYGTGSSLGTRAEWMTKAIPSDLLARP